MSERIVVVREEDLYDYRWYPNMYMWVGLALLLFLFSYIYCFWCDSAPPPPTRVLRYRLIEEVPPAERP